MKLDVYYMVNTRQVDSLGIIYNPNVIIYLRFNFSKLFIVSDLGTRLSWRWREYLLRVGQWIRFWEEFSLRENG